MTICLRSTNLYLFKNNKVFVLISEMHFYFSSQKSLKQCNQSSQFELLVLFLVTGHAAYTFITRAKIMCINYIHIYQILLTNFEVNRRTQLQDHFACFSLRKFLTGQWTLLNMETDESTVNQIIFKCLVCVTFFGIKSKHWHISQLSIHKGHVLQFLL